MSSLTLLARRSAEGPDFCLESAVSNMVEQCPRTSALKQLRSCVALAGRSRATDLRAWSRAS